MACKDSACKMNGQIYSHFSIPNRTKAKPFSYYLYYRSRGGKHATAAAREVGAPVCMRISLK